MITKDGKLVRVWLTESEVETLKEILLRAIDHFNDQAGDMESDNEPGIAESWRDLAWAADRLRDEVIEARKAATT